VPLAHHAEGSHVPASKSIPIRLTRDGATAVASPR